MEFISKSWQEIENNNNQNSPRPAAIPSPRSDPNNPYPTTFVQADTSNFKQVVQMLTGTASNCSSSSSSETFKQTPSRQIPPKKQGFKLYERRNININNNRQLMINTLLSSTHKQSSSSPPEILSPSVLDFPSLTLLSPVTPLTNDVVGEDKSTSEEEEEEISRAIAEKGFFLHPSPRAAEQYGILNYPHLNIPPPSQANN
ncbi:VQ motif-containing protein 4-like [Morus notabilis]|uniref:VQ motif-containing protein 4-like n=1 Tax=Morus notabilis TaxID=981085 RepID=UPI000CED7DCB|nr:VQ motif-containing protein 4-like [Morus notabilis]